MIVPAEDLMVPLRLVLWTREFDRHLYRERIRADLLEESPPKDASLLDNNEWTKRLKRILAPQIEDLGNGERSDGALLQLLVDLPQSVVFSEVQEAVCGVLLRRDSLFFARLGQGLQRVRRGAVSTVSFEDYFDLAEARERGGGSIREAIRVATGVTPEEADKNRAGREALRLQKRFYRTARKLKSEVLPQMEVLVLPCRHHRGRVMRIFEGQKLGTAHQWWKIEPGEVQKGMAMADPSGFMLPCPRCGNDVPLGEHGCEIERLLQEAEGTAHRRP